MDDLVEPCRHGRKDELVACGKMNRASFHEVLVHLMHIACPTNRRGTVILNGQFAQLHSH